MLVNVDAIWERAKATAKNLNHWKQQGITDKTVTIDGLLTYCDEMDALCKRVKNLERDNAVLKQHIKDNK